MNKEQIIDSGILEQYVLGDLDSDQMASVEDYLKQYPSLNENLKKIEDTLLRLSEQNAVQAPTNLKSKILDKIDQMQAEQPIEYSQPYKFWKNIALTAAAIAAMSLVVGAYFYGELEKQKREYAALSESYVTLSEDCSEERNSNQQNQQILAFIQASGTQVIDLKPLADNAQSVYTYWNPRTQQAIIKNGGLPTLQDGEVYQLWADIDGEMISMGLLNLNEQLQEIPFMSKAESLNITIEPTGGSDHPNVSRLVVSGKVEV